LAIAAVDIANDNAMMLLQTLQGHAAAFENYVASGKRDHPACFRLTAPADAAADEFTVDCGQLSHVAGMYATSRDSATQTLFGQLVRAASDRLSSALVPASIINNPRLVNDPTLQASLFDNPRKSEIAVDLPALSLLLRPFETAMKCNAVTFSVAVRDAISRAQKVKVDAKVNLFIDYALSKCLNPLTDTPQGRLGLATDLELKMR
jgi:hypothetical protein